MEVGRSQLEQSQKIELQDVENDLKSKLDQEMDLFNDKELKMNQHIKTVERERDQLQRELNSIKVVISEKEKDVKDQVNRTWSEWQDKYEHLEGLYNDTRRRNGDLEVAKKKLTQDLRETQRREMDLDQ